MSTTNSLEQQGKLEAAPAVELLSEAAKAGLSGTFRFARESFKIAVYLDAGEVVFAASNLKTHRLAQKFVQWNVLREAEIGAFNNLPDLELGKQLLASGKLTPLALEMSQNRQISEIVSTALAWTTGEWHFNPLVRVKEDLRAAIDLPALLTEAARNLPPEFAQTRIESDTETFVAVQDAYGAVDLSPEEAFVHSRIEGIGRFEPLAAMTGLSVERLTQILYALWLGGMIRRFNNPLFDEQLVRQMLTARITLSQPKPAPEIKPEPVAAAEAVEPPKIETPAPAAPEEVDEERAVNGFLLRVEHAQTHYQAMGLGSEASAAEIKQNYFKIAKRFHPDKYHHLAGETKHTRLQNAFSKILIAYDTLKDQKSRELYDHKLRKSGGIDAPETAVSEQTPEQIFKSGVAAYETGNYNQAVAFLTRAANLSPDNAEYQARFGQALSKNPNFRRQAENALQNAVRLDDKNTSYRLMLAQFYVSVGLGKRAEGELNRVLALEPDHAAARQLLANLR